MTRAAPDPSRPPIVLVSIDTLRPDRLSAGGDPRPTSPELDRFLREGTHFVDATTTSPGSAPSHASLFTARYPVSHGVFTNFTILHDEVETLAEILTEEGYRTAGFATNTFLGRRFGFDQGFDDLTGRVADAAEWNYLGANVYEKGTQNPALPEYDVIEIDGVQVGFVGVVTQETPTLVTPSGIADLDLVTER